MAAADGVGLPLAIGAASASPHETQLLEVTLDESLIDELPERLIGDKAYCHPPPEVGGALGLASTFPEAKSPSRMAPCKLAMAST